MVLVLRASVPAGAPASQGRSSPRLPDGNPGGGSTLTAPALPAVSWQLRRPGTTKISLIEVSTLPGDSRAYAKHSAAWPSVSGADHSPHHNHPRQRPSGRSGGIAQRQVRHDMPQPARSLQPGGHGSSSSPLAPPGKILPPGMTQLL